MSRLIDAFEQFFDGNGQPLANGYLRFYENGTTTLQDTYSDEAQTIPNANPMQLTGDGRVNGNVYASLAYTVELLDSDLNVIESFDDVIPRGGVATANTIPTWDSTALYDAATSIVLAGDGNYYIALQQNMNINPVTDTNYQYWKKVQFEEFWSGFVSYSKGDVKIGSDGKYYESLVNSNLNNNPVGDGGVNWEEQHTNTWSIGRDYLTGEFRLGSNGKWYKAQQNNTGNDPIADDGTNWRLAQGEVSKPTNTAPADAATGVSRTPTLTTSAFTVLGGSDTHEYSIYQLSKDSFATVDYNILTNTDLVSHTVPTLLDGATEYSYRARHKGVFAGLSDWSDVTTFTTTFPLSSFYQVDIDTGTGAARTVVNGVDISTNAGAVFIANITSATSEFKIVDTQRGVGNALQPGVNALQVSEPNGVTAFNTDGYSVGTDAEYNANTESIFSFTIRRQAKLFDMVRYTGTGANRTIAHGLDAPVGLMFCLQESGSVPGGSPYIRGWFSSQVSGTAVNRIFTGAAVTTPDATVWNSTAPTNSVFSLGTSPQVNDSGDVYNMYLFANEPAAGIKSGSYTGTGSSGNKVVTGFSTGLVIIMNATTSVRPTVIISKQLGTGSKIEITNGVTQSTVGGPSSFDSDGFTLGSDTQTNQSGNTFYYLAIADENLF